MASTFSLHPSILVSDEGMYKLLTFLCGVSEEAWKAKKFEHIMTFCLYWKKMCFRILMADIFHTFVVDYIEKDTTLPLLVSKLDGLDLGDFAKEFAHDTSIFECLKEETDPYWKGIVDAFSPTENSTKEEQEFFEQFYEILLEHYSEMAGEWGIEMFKLKKGDPGLTRPNFMKDCDRLCYSTLPLLDYCETTKTLFVENARKNVKFPLKIFYDEQGLKLEIESFKNSTDVVIVKPINFDLNRDPQDERPAKMIKT